MDANVFELNSKIEMTHWWFVARRQIIARLVHRLLSPREGHRIVDVGCGTGGNISCFSKDYSCVGIDPSEDAIRWAKERFPDVEFIQGYAPQDLSHEQQHADLLMLNDVLEHVPDDFQVLSSLLAVSKPGAYFVITVPADMSLWSPHDTIHRHYRRYTAERLEQSWAGLPVTCLLKSHFNTRLYPVVKALRTLNRQKKTSSGDRGTDLKVPSSLINGTLTSIFQGEGQRLESLLERQSGRAYRRGVSLVAVLRREDGDITPRERPAELADDPALLSWS